MIRVILSLTLFFCLSSLLAQEPNTFEEETDTTIIISEPRPELFVEISNLNPRKAAFRSAILPGLGQIYNKQYWKLPFIIGGGAVIGHYIRYQDRLYRSFRSAWLALNDTDPDTENEFTSLSEAAIERNAMKLRRDRDYLMIIGGLFYLLQIADANIAAHLHEFQINKELSLKIRPAIHPTNLISQSLGLNLSLKFK